MFRRSVRPTRSGTSAKYLAVGLGNPGTEFAGTRHNVGAQAIEVLRARHHGDLRVEKGMFARAGVVTILGERLALGIPTAYMNDSGVALSPLVTRYVEGEPSRLIVVHDELDLPVGTVRVKLGGGTAGHNGLRSAQSHLRSLDFVRVRIGIGKPKDAQSGKDHVLRRPSKKEQELLDGAIEIAADAVESIVRDGVDRTMTAFNSR